MVEYPHQVQVDKVDSDHYICLGTIVGFPENHRHFLTHMYLSYYNNGVEHVRMGSEAGCIYIKLDCALSTIADG